MTATGEPGNMPTALDRRMSVLELVDAAVVADGVLRLSLPHVVHLLDHSSGLASVFGPFDDAVDALGFADQLASALADTTTLGLAVTVIALEPPD